MRVLSTPGVASGPPCHSHVRTHRRHQTTPRAAHKRTATEHIDQQGVWHCNGQSTVCSGSGWFPASLSGLPQPAAFNSVQWQHHHQHKEHCSQTPLHPAPQATAVVAGAVAFSALLIPSFPASAHIPLEPVQSNPGLAQALSPEANIGVRPGSLRRSGVVPAPDVASSYDSAALTAAATQPLQRQPPARAVSTASRAKVALAELEAAHEAVRDGRFDQALDAYSSVVQDYGDLALAGYARTGRALMLYQVGRTTDALLALEEQEALLRGTAEIHAALAAILWTEKPSLAFRAEQQWEVAREFDSRYTDPQWVRDTKYWPPRALDALSRFLTLQR